MGLRTYLPTLQFIARRLCKYIHDHEATLRANLGDDGDALLDAVLTACDALEVAIVIVSGS